MLDLQEAASNTLAKDQFLKKTEDVAMPRILWALGAVTSLGLAPEWTITSRNKKEMPFLDMAREGLRGDTKSLRGLSTNLEVLATYSDKERTGHKSISSGKPAAKSERD